MNDPHRLRLFGLLALGLALVAHSARAGGLPVSTAENRQWGPRIVANPAGGAWTTWLDFRSGYATHVYGSRLDANGTPATVGANQGDELTRLGCEKWDLAFIADGTGGTLATWSDHRCDGNTGYDIFVLRLGADGLPVPGWPASGTAVTSAPGAQVCPAIAADGAGGAFVAWNEEGTADGRVLAHHVLPGGTLDPAWPAAGLVLAGTAADSAAASVGPDGAGGFYVAWEDHRHGTWDIRLQRVTSAGEASPGWPDAGVAACTWSDDQRRPILVAGVSGVALVWLDARDARTQLYAVRFLPNGGRAPGWPAGGRAVAPGPGEQRDPVLARADVGGLRVAWSEDRDMGSGADVYAQRLDSTGTAADGWPTGGAVVCRAPGAQFEPALAVDGSGGSYFAWTDRRDSAATGEDAWVQRLDGSGVVATGWPADGIALDVIGGDQREVRLTGNGHGGVFAVWTDGRNAATTGDDIAAREVGPGGPLAPRATGLVASHHDGQTFLRWSAAPGRGWTYRLYASAAPISSPAELAAATFIGAAGDSAACDARLSQLLGTTVGRRIEPGGTDLAPQDGLFVRTTQQSGATFYAVTSTPGLFTEDATIVPGDNALLTAVTESVARPRPVHQRTVQQGGRDVEIWTLWTWHEDVPGFPAMAAVPGLAFDCALVRGQTALAPLVVGFHARGGSLFDGVGGVGLAGEWVLACDDFLPNGQSTFWYGYHRNYDVHAASGPLPLTGPVVDFTARRVDWTLDWACREFPIDTTRVFTYGYSMGAMGATQLAFRAPGKIAGLMSVIGVFDFSFQSDPVPECWFNPQGWFRRETDLLWGTVDENLPSSAGPPVFEVLNGARLVSSDDTPDLPPMMAFNGRRDVNVGWAEKVHFWAAMQEHRRGGYFFWDNRTHGVTGAVWMPMQVPLYLDRFRTDRSYPALSNGDLDGDPGDGLPASGDSIGTLNGHLEWNVPSEDTQSWSVTLTLRGLVLTTGGIPAPESALVDVTPRRLRSYGIAPNSSVPYRVVRSADEALLAHGVVTADDQGTVTIEEVRVHRTGTRVEIGARAAAGVEPAVHAAGLQVACVTPARGGTLEATVDWPSGDEGRLVLLDVGGRRVVTLFDGRPAAGRSRYTARATVIAPGLYFLLASSGQERRVQRVVVLR